MTRNKAETLRRLIEQMAVNLGDKEASEGAELFPQLKENGALVSAGTRINWNGVIKKAAVDLWDATENNPDNAPDLWEDIFYREGYRIIPETITAGTAFELDEHGWWGDTLYKSKLAANVYTPEQYPEGWEFVKKEE